jgi:hypothetical protein
MARKKARDHRPRAWSWQRKSFHHRIRNRIEYEEKLTYVSENPIRKQLVARLDQWPYQGRLHDVRWTADESGRDEFHLVPDPNWDDVEVVPTLCRQGREAKDVGQDRLGGFFGRRRGAGQLLAWAVSIT